LGYRNSLLNLVEAGNRDGTSGARNSMPVPAGLTRPKMQGGLLTMRCASMLLPNGKMARR